jgi:hypothetical protein
MKSDQQQDLIRLLSESAKTVLIPVRDGEETGLSIFRPFRNEIFDPEVFLANANRFSISATMVIFG